MIPDLGKYADTVMAAYGVSLVLLIALVLVSVTASRRAAKALKSAEERRKRHG